MEDVYKNIEENNLGKKRKKLIFFGDIIANINNFKNKSSSNSIVY